MSFSEDPKYLENLWTVQSGILAITVTVVVFIVQSINSRYTRQNIFRIFVRRSLIFPIIYLNLVNIAGISWLLFYYDPSKQMGLVCLICTVFLICIFLVGWLYVIVFKFLDPIYVQKERIKQLKKTFEIYLADELKAKVGEIMLYQLCLSSEVEYDPWKTETKNPIEATKVGKIVDINFRKIVKIL